MGLSNSRAPRFAPRLFGLFLAGLIINVGMIWVMSLRVSPGVVVADLPIELLIVDASRLHQAPPSLTVGEGRSTPVAPDPTMPATLGAGTVSHEAANVPSESGVTGGGLIGSDTARRIAGTLARRYACRLTADQNTDRAECAPVEVSADRTISSSFVPAPDKASPLPVLRPPNRDCPAANLGAGCAGEATWKVIKKTW